MRRIALITTIAMSWTIMASAAQARCPAEAAITDYVPGGGLCLAAATYGAESAGTAPTLVVSLHGDVSAGGPGDYLFSFARGLARPGVVSVALLRPGYGDSAGRRSDGSDNGRRDHYTSGNIAAVGAAIDALKKHYKARRVVLVGHSGGAAFAGVLIGRRPGLAQGAVLVSCPCDIPRWRSERGRGAWPNSQSPMAAAGGVPKGTRVIAITGSSDDNTTPALAEDYVAALAKRGVSARFEPASGGHGFSGLWNAADTAARSLIGG